MIPGSPFLVLAVYLLVRLVIFPTKELKVGIRFNGLALGMMVTQYFYPTYLPFLAFMIGTALYYLLAQKESLYIAYLLGAIGHAVYHDEFMAKENTLWNATVDYMLHAMMFLYVADLYKHRKMARFFSVVGVLNVIVGLFSIDFKYFNKCNELLFGLGPNQPLTEGCPYWIGGYGAFTTVLLATAAIAGTICARDPSLSPELLFLETCPYFFATTAWYFVTDPLWVAALYDEIKYDQFYFILPVFWNMLPSLTSSSIEKPKQIVAVSATALSSVMA